MAGLIGEEGEERSWGTGLVQVMGRATVTPQI